MVQHGKNSELVEEQRQLGVEEESRDKRNASEFARRGDHEKAALFTPE